MRRGEHDGVAVVDGVDADVCGHGCSVGWCCRCSWCGPGGGGVRRPAVGSGEDVENVGQTASGPLVQGLEDKRGVEAPVAAAAEAQDLALVGRGLVARRAEIEIVIVHRV